jgi:TonB family protein
MKLYFSLLLLTISLGSFAQVHKIFLNKNGKVTKDSAKAFEYILCQKEGADSLWSYVKLDRRGIPIEKGTYLDEELTIPNGKFVYYQTIIEQKKIDEHHSSIDTIIGIKQTGFYENGLKEGYWVSYFPNGQKQSIKPFANNQLNGLVEEYDDEGKIFSRSNYINGLREGDCYIFKSDSSIQSCTNFWHGNVVKTKDYAENEKMYNAYPGFNFEYHIYRYLKKLGLPTAHGFVMISFYISADGRLSNPKVLMGVNPALDEAITEAVKNSPTWVPAKLNKRPIDQSMTFTFEYDSTKQ